MGVRVETEAGFVEGVECEGVALLLVPHAAPPVGEGRFLGPLPVMSWTGKRRDTSRVSPPQLPMPALVGSDEQAPNDEDCLELNIYTRGRRRSAPGKSHAFGPLEGRPPNMRPHRASVSSVIGRSTPSVAASSKAIRRSLWARPAPASIASTRVGLSSSPKGFTVSRIIKAVMPPLSASDARIA